MTLEGACMIRENQKLHTETGQYTSAQKKY